MKTRKFLAMILALVMTAGFATVPAFASGETGGQSGTQEQTFDHNISFEDSANYTLASDSGGFTIDLATEKFANPGNVTIEAYSVDGGQKWKAGKPDEDISKLLNKGMELWLTDKFDSKAKEPAKEVQADTEKNIQYSSAANVYKFQKIEARPKLDKLAINYEIAADASGNTNGQWVLAKKDAPTVAVRAAANGPLQVAPASADKKAPDGNKWGFFKDSEGVNIKDLTSDGKAQKTVYLYRSAPVVAETVIPASKPAKVTASSAIKSPAFKIDYKKEIIKTKIGSFYSKAVKKENDDDFDYEFGAEIVSFDTKEAAAEGIVLKNTDPAKELFGEVLVARMKATSKKPASAMQVIEVAPRPGLFQVDFKPTFSKGKLVYDKRAYEFLANAATDKWGAIPKATGSETYTVRMKNTAKYNAKTGETTGTPASLTMTFKTVWDVYQQGKTSAKDKSGIVGYTVTSFPKYEGLIWAELADGVSAVRTVKEAEWLGSLANETFTYKLFEYKNGVVEPVTYTVELVSNLENDNTALKAEATGAGVITVSKQDSNPAFDAGSFTFSLKPVAVTSDDGLLRDKFYAPTVTVTLVAAETVTVTYKAVGDTTNAPTAAEVAGIKFVGEDGVATAPKTLKLEIDDLKFKLDGVPTDSLDAEYEVAVTVKVGTKASEPIAAVSDVYTLAKEKIDGPVELTVTLKKTATQTGG